MDIVDKKRFFKKYFKATDKLVEVSYGKSSKQYILYLYYNYCCIGSVSSRYFGDIAFLFNRLTGVSLTDDKINRWFYGRFNEITLFGEYGLDVEEFWEKNEEDGKTRNPYDRN